MKNIKKYEDLLEEAKYYEDKEGYKYLRKKMRDNEGRCEIRYRIYSDNVIEFMGSYTDPKHRGQGLFTELLNKFLDKYKGYVIYVPISNKKIIPMFLRLGFEETDEPLRYWGKLNNSLNVIKHN